MKPLKFRVWYSRSDGYGTPVMLYSYERNHFYEFFEQSCPDEDKAEQFTGLVDSNGRDIYENDFVRIIPSIDSPLEGTYKVIWDGIKLRWALAISEWNLYSLARAHLGIRVVGNAHESSK